MLLFHCIIDVCVFDFLSEHNIRLFFFKIFYLSSRHSVALASCCVQAPPATLINCTTAATTTTWPPPPSRVCRCLATDEYYHGRHIGFVLFVCFDDSIVILIVYPPKHKP